MRDRGTNLPVQFPWHSPTHRGWETLGEGAHSLCAALECSTPSPLQAASHIEQLTHESCYYDQIWAGFQSLFPDIRHCLMSSLHIWCYGKKVLNNSRLRSVAEHKLY